MRDLASGARALMGVVTERHAYAGPRSVALAICEVCNTDCVMCWCHSPAARARGARPSASPYMDPAVLETIIRQTGAMGTYASSSPVTASRPCTRISTGRSSC